MATAFTEIVIGQPYCAHKDPESIFVLLRRGELPGGVPYGVYLRNGEEKTESTAYGALWQVDPVWEVAPYVIEELVLV